MLQSHKRRVYLICDFDISITKAYSIKKQYSTYKYDTLKLWTVSTKFHLDLRYGYLDQFTWILFSL